MVRESIKDVPMETNPKMLSINQLFGYQEKGLSATPTDQLCQAVYPLCWEFMEDMLDTVYSDGPVYFKSYPFNKEKPIVIFTTIGNQTNPTGQLVEPLCFKEKVLVASDDFTTLSPSELEDYYAYLADKYSDSNLETLAVYHVLYHPEQARVDVYSSWEVV